MEYRGVLSSKLGTSKCDGNEDHMVTLHLAPPLSFHSTSEGPPHFEESRNARTDLGGRVFDNQLASVKLDNAEAGRDGKHAVAKGVDHFEEGVEDRRPRLLRAHPRFHRVFEDGHKVLAALVVEGKEGGEGGG